MKVLHAKTRGLKMSLIKRSPHEAEVTAIDKDNREWIYPVDIEKRTCSFVGSGRLLESHAFTHYFSLLLSMVQLASKIDQYVHDYYSIAKFNATYTDNLPAMEGKQQWGIVDPGFKLCAPVQNRP